MWDRRAGNGRPIPKLRAAEIHRLAPGTPRPLTPEPSVVKEQPRPPRHSDQSCLTSLTRQWGGPGPYQEV